MDCVADTNNGAVIGDWVCSGYIYSANVGWIISARQTHRQRFRYENLDASDFGVNQDGLGNLIGYASGANIGWINFEQTFGQRDEFAHRATERLCLERRLRHRISLSNSVAYVQNRYLYPGPLAPNGLPIPWLLTYFGCNVNANSDPLVKV